MKEKSILDYKVKLVKPTDLVDGNLILTTVIIPLNKTYMKRFENNCEIKTLREINEKYKFNLSLPVIFLSYLLGKGHLKTSLLYMLYYKKLLETKKDLNDTKLLIEPIPDFDSIIKILKRFENNTKTKIEFQNIYKEYKDKCLG